jgi:UDP-GlcNAc3NAcA epimerase
MKIITVVGARPQFIKSSVLSNVFTNNYSNINEIIIHTGQHFDSNMSNIFFEQLSIKKPKYNLNIGGGTHGQMTGRQIEQIEQVLLNEKPNLVIVYGDTNSTLSASIAASKLNIPIAHVEAGLRSFNKNMPEEQNRIISDHLSSYLFAPSELSVSNLLKENISNSNIFNYGDIMFDVINVFKKQEIKPIISQNIPSNYILCTFHREENTENPKKLSEIIRALNECCQNIIFPIHPRTKNAITKNNLSLSDKIICIDPIGYLQMSWLLSNCDFVITDSGGVQKESFFHNKYCIVTRNETEWTELVKLGFNVLTGANSENILRQIKNKTIVNSLNVSPYGNGTTAIQIAKKLAEIL